MADDPLVLVDSPDDGYCETLGWVETTVSEDKARDLLAPWCMDEDGDPDYRPTGPSRKVLLVEQDPAENYGERRWLEVGDELDTSAPDTEKIEFWEIVVA